MFPILATMRFVSLISLLASSFQTDTHSTLLASKMIGGQFDRTITKAVFFTYNTDFKCAGYLVSRRIALGPALCLFELKPPDYDGYRVSNDDVFIPRKQIEEPRPGYSIKKINVHENFSHWEKNVYINDIAVVLLGEPAVNYDSETPWTMSIFLKTVIHPCELASLLGWSPQPYSDDRSMCGAKAKFRMYSRIVEDDVCKDIFGCSQMHKSHMCAYTFQGYFTEEDAGSPLLTSKLTWDNSEGLIGLAGYTQCEKRSFSIFTRISYHHKFIRQETVKLENVAFAERYSYNASHFELKYD